VNNEYLFYQDASGLPEGLTLADYQYEFYKNSSSARFYGQIAKITSGTIDVDSTNTYQSTGLTATLVDPSLGVSLGTDDTFAVKNTSGKTRVFQIVASMDCNTAATNAVGIQLALNGDNIPESNCRAWAVVGQSAKLVTTFLVEMEDDDEVSLRVANHSGTGDITFFRGRIVATTVG
jgi:hypothetical protein